MVTIVSHRERSENEMGCTLHRVGGASDGEEFRMVEVSFSDGSTQWLFASNAREGFFKHVFVPWDFDHPKVV